MFNANRGHRGNKDGHQGLSNKIDKERKLIDIKHIKEGIQIAKEKGIGTHHSAANIIGGLGKNNEGLGDKDLKNKPFSYKKKKIYSIYR